MSDLQVGLAVLGVLVVAAVVAFNWWQERRFRRHAERDMVRPEEDVLFHPRRPAPAGPSPSRIEPQFSHEPAAARATPERATTGAVPGLAPAPDEMIDYVAEIHADVSLRPSALSEMATALAGTGRALALSGYSAQTDNWQPLGNGDRSITGLRIGLQLADRNGPVTVEELQAFRDLVQEWAARLSASAQCPEVESAATRAEALDRFLTETDVMIGINVLAHSGQVFHATRIRALAEANGMRLRADGLFVFTDELGRTLFTVDNQEPRPFRPDQVRHITTNGVTFLLDVPRTRDGLKAFDRMLGMSRQFADSLDGMLVDDRRQALTESGLDKIRAQLREIYAVMEAQGLPAGSAAALRLFA
jgi:FtsZ-interacting cell division protein ZipA